MVDFASIEKKWQKVWDEKGIFKVSEDKSKEKFYVLEMFPYPSASGLHMGHALNYTIGDIFARFKRMTGFNVLYPMGFDSLGLPTENASIKAGVHPRKFTEEAVKNYIRQMKNLGLSYDWSRIVETHKPDYFKWDQWIFLQMYKRGLVYKKTSGVNWCSKCNTVLANEQVHNGMCWRHDDTEVEVKHLSQWFLKISEYSDELYEGIKDLVGWPDTIKKLQLNWINKSFGTEIVFKINGEDWKVFTTRPDTLFGVTFMVVSAQHSKLDELVTDENKQAVDDFRKKIHSVKQEDMDKLEKEGVFTGSFAVHPLTGEEIPVYAGNFVLAEYGSGMVMAVPAHDQRDFEFAKKYEIPIKDVVKGKNEQGKAFTGEGVLVNSKEFNGLSSEVAKKEITKKLESLGVGSEKVNFRLRDWLISRQRYWGTPIPVYYDEDNNPCPVPEDLLPIVLPDDVTFKEGIGNPLETSKSHFVEINGKKYRLETDTMDTFVNSSWYFLRYTDSKNEKEIFSKENVNYWCPVDFYIGGKEHACMHLIYSRFYTKFLRDIGLLKFGEPAKRLFNQGMLLGPDGEKMSKSKGNVVLPETVSDKYGIDSARLFLVSQASPDKDIAWSDTGAEGSFRFVNKLLRFSDSFRENSTSSKVVSKIHKTVRNVTSYIENMKYNLAVIELRELFSEFDKGLSKKDFEVYIKLLSPFMPHIAEELWSRLGNKTLVSVESWPVFDESLIDEKSEYLDDLILDLREDIRSVIKLIGISPKKIRVIVSSEWKYDFIKLYKSIIKETRDSKEIIKRVMSTDLKNHSKDVMKLIPLFLKDESKLTREDISLVEELKNIEENMNLVKDEFGCEVLVEKADDSKEQKADKALPGKPAILVE
ncbi:leucine--tRNA ligase [Candidatus Woesearchaeota archaeon]|jgi:leucyl-tRNA synthetase|nr:leucine--tRNA ligase [Candidatus Woesearchaeota archaeon]